ncbi:MAG TPA: TIR domain-containing protein, partial [Bryobacteraceae bacterium]|nr:TIR domain-containing protein [Bryobacteraceae bacterium]
GAGQDWRIATAKALESSQIFVLLFSENAAESSDIAKELAAATLEKKLIIPVRLQNIAPKGAFLYELASRNWVNAYEGTEAKLAELAKGLAHLVRTGARDESVLPFDRGGGHTPAQTAIDAKPAAAIASPPPALRRVGIPGLTLILVVMVTAGALLWRSLRPAVPAGAQATSQDVTQKAESGAPVFSPPAHSIAVLPFVNMSGDPKEDYFSDGVSEELLNALAGLNDLQVAARTSSFSFKGQNVDVATIAHKLNVGAVLEGSVRRSGNTVRITAQLINTVTGFHLWSETYDRPFTDIFKVQTEVATAVAQQLEIKLAGSESARFEVGGTKNPDAYDAYLRARRLYGVRTAEGLRAPLAEIDQAIALDPDYAAAYALRAEVLTYLSYEPNIEGVKALREQAIASAERAVALAPDLGDAHVALGIVHARILLDFVGAGAEFDRAFAVAPGSAYVQDMFAAWMGLIGHSESALVGAQRVVSLDPQNPGAHFREGLVFYHAKRYNEALAAFRHAQALQPESTDVNRFFIEVLFRSGQMEQARQLLETPTTRVDQSDRHHLLAMVYRGLGRQADADHELAQYKKIVGDARPYRMAEIYAQWGDAPAALQSLLRAEQSLDINFFLIKVDPLLDPIRNDPQFKAFLARLKFPP